MVAWDVLMHTHQKCQPSADISTPPVQQVTLKIKTYFYFEWVQNQKMEQTVPEGRIQMTGWLVCIQKTTSFWLSEHISKAIQSRQVIWNFSHHPTFFMVPIQEKKQRLLCCFSPHTKLCTYWRQSRAGCSRLGTCALHPTSSFSEGDFLKLPGITH